MAQVRARCSARRLPQRDQFPTRQHHLQRVHNIFNVAIGGGELTRGSGGNPAAHRTDANRLRPVPNRQPHRGHRLLRHQTVDASLDRE